MMNDMIGKTFNYWTVLAFARKDKWGKRVWTCKCRCGKIRDIWERDLANGQSKSCGCMKGVLKIQAMGSHGKSKTRLYKRWLGMKDRCCNPNDWRYQYYGGKGVRVCDEWRDDFLTYEKWMINNGYVDDSNISIDRIDVNGNYSPDNCRLVSRKEQANNKTTNRYIKVGDKKLTVALWAEELGVTPDCITARLENGLPDDIAVNHPPIRNRKRNPDGTFARESFIKEDNDHIRKLT